MKEACCLRQRHATHSGAAARAGYAPALHAEVGDVLVVKLAQALTLHLHGVRYTPDYDGVYLGEHTRVGGFVAPGEEFTYTWEATPDSVAVWPYHDHGPKHTPGIYRIVCTLHEEMTMTIRRR